MRSILFILLLIPFFTSFGQTPQHFREDLPCVNKQFNVYVHTVYDSLRTTATRNEIEDALETANGYFAPICISFALCEMDTVFNYNFNILKPNEEMSELSTLYVGQNRLNLFVISDTLTEDNVGGICSGTVGSMFNPNIFLQSLGSLTHELGHFFGIPHTFGGAIPELVDGSNCETAGDLICDTPADPFDEDEDVEDYVKDCIFYAEMTDANGDYYQPQVGNIMSYYQCACGFTHEQYMKMAENYFKANQKQW